MLGLDVLSFRAVVVIVLYVSMFVRVFGRIRMVRRNLCHWVWDQTSDRQKRGRPL